MNLPQVGEYHIVRTLRFIGKVTEVIPGHEYITPQCPKGVKGHVIAFDVGHKVIFEESDFFDDKFKKLSESQVKTYVLFQNCIKQVIPEMLAVAKAFKLAPDDALNLLQYTLEDASSAIKRKGSLNTICGIT